MGINSFNNKLGNGSNLKPSDINQFQDALNETVVGRELGVPKKGKDLGSVPLPWGTLYTENINVKGQNVDLTQFLRGKYLIVSGRTQSQNGLPNLIQPESTSSRRFRISGDIVDLVLIINGRRIVIDKDIQISLQFQASQNYGINIKDAKAPGQTNPYQGSFSHDGFEKGYIGENAGNKDVIFSTENDIFSGEIPIEFAEITGAPALSSVVDSTKQLRESLFTNESLQLFSFGNPGNPNAHDRNNREYFLARPIKRGSEYFLTDIKRRNLIGIGNTLGSSFNILQMQNSPTRDIGEINDLGTISNRRGLTVHRLVWVFIDADNPTNPITIDVEPLYTVTGDPRIDNAEAWFNLDKEEWMIRRNVRDSFEKKDVIPIGIVSNGYMPSSSDTSTPLVRSFNFSRDYNRINTIRLRQLSNHSYESKDEMNKVSVYGNMIETKKKLKLTIERNLSIGNCIYFYLTDNGSLTFEVDIPPIYDEELFGYYHPVKSFRCVGHQVIGITSIGISHKYSTVEKYERQYKMAVTFDGTATSTKNDAVISSIDHDGEILSRIFSLSRPTRLLNLTTYAAFNYTINKSGLFREIVETFGSRTRILVYEADYKFIGPTPPSSGVKPVNSGGVGVGISEGKYFVSFNTSSIPNAGTSRGRITITINRLAMDWTEKRLWNGLSS